MKALWRTLNLWSLLFCMSAFFAVSGCGKKGLPLPDLERDMFSFSEYSATLRGGVINIECRISGAVRNLEYVVLEIEPVDGELCTGCPFLAVEQKHFDSRELWDGSVGERISLSYQPGRMMDSYRWRIVGHNILTGLPDVEGEVMTVENSTGRRTGMPEYGLGE